MQRPSQRNDAIDKARSLAASGRLGPARRAYKEALRAQPDHPELLQEAGFVEVEAGRVKDAAKFMQKAADLAPNDPNAHINAAEVYRLLGDLQRAEEYFRKTIALDPVDPDAHHGLADLLIGSGSWDEAEDHVRTARSLSPDDPEVLNLFGVIHERNGKKKEAQDAFERAVSLAPHFADAICNLAALLAEMNRLEEAVERYQQACGLRPLTDQQLNNLYNCYVRLDQATEALRTAELLVAADEKNSEALVLRGSAHRATGDFDAAERDYRTALQIDANCASAYENLGVIHKLTSDDIADIEERLTQAELPDVDRVGFWYALYHGYNSERAYERAFDSLLNANRVLSAESPIEISQMAKSTERTMGVFSPDFFQDRKTFGHLTPGPVFIVGMPRSGTTLTERILAAHPQISGGGERYDVPNLTGGIEDYPHALLEKDGDWAVEAGRRIHRSMFSRAAEADFATDKLPGNHVNLGLISMILPGSKFIYCKRNPIDNCLSCFEQHFADGLNFTFSLEGLAEAYMQHEKLMGHWFDVCPIPIHTVEYENLVSDPEPVVRGMLDYIGVKWDPACLNPEKTEQSIATASVWQARQPINKGSIARWRRYEKQLQPLIEALEQK